MQSWVQRTFYSNSITVPRKGIEKIKADLQQPRKLVISDRTIQTQMRFSVLIGRKAVYASRKFHAPTIEREAVQGCKCVEAFCKSKLPSSNQTNENKVAGNVSKKKQS